MCLAVGWAMGNGHTVQFQQRCLWFDSFHKRYHLWNKYFKPCMMFACVKCVLNAVEAARVLMYTYTVLVFLMHSE